MAGNADFIKWGTDPTQEARQAAQARLNGLMLKALQAIETGLESGDPKLALQAAGMVLDRTIPKLRQVDVKEELDGVIESDGRKSLREEIEELIVRRAGLEEKRKSESRNVIDMRELGA